MNIIRVRGLAERIRDAAIAISALECSIGAEGNEILISIYRADIENYIKELSSAATEAEQSKG